MSYRRLWQRYTGSDDAIREHVRVVRAHGAIVPSGTATVVPESKFVVFLAPPGNECATPFQSYIFKDMSYIRAILERRDYFADRRGQVVPLYSQIYGPGTRVPDMILSFREEDEDDAHVGDAFYGTKRVPYPQNYQPRPPAFLRLRMQVDFADRAEAYARDASFYQPASHPAERTSLGAWLRDAGRPDGVYIFGACRGFVHPDAKSGLYSLNVQGARHFQNVVDMELAARALHARQVGLADVDDDQGWGTMACRALSTSGGTRLADPKRFQQRWGLTRYEFHMGELDRSLNALATRSSRRERLSCYYSAVSRGHPRLERFFEHNDNDNATDTADTADTIATTDTIATAAGDSGAPQRRRNRSRSPPRRAS